MKKLLMILFLMSSFSGYANSTETDTPCDANADLRRCTTGSNCTNLDSTASEAPTETQDSTGTQQ